MSDRLKLKLLPRSVLKGRVIGSFGSGSGGGDVFGPPITNDGTIARFEGTDGKHIEGSGVFLDGGNNISNVFNLQLMSYIQLREIAAPASPPANDVRVYAKDVGGLTHLFQKDSAGLEIDLTLAGGGGGGDVFGPSGAADGTLCRYEGTTGKLIDTSGVFLDGANNLSNVTSVALATGLPSAPAITHTGDLDTGLYFPTTDAVAISTAGQARLAIDADGRTTVLIPLAPVIDGAQAAFNTMPTASALLNQANMLYSADNAPPIVAFGKSRNATAGLHTQVVLNDGLGQLSFYGSDGTNFRPGANIRALVNGTPAVNRVPGRLVFATTPAVGSTTPVDRLLLDELGLRPTIDSLCSLGSTALGYAHVFLNGYIEFSEVGFVVPTPAANDLRLYAKDVAGVTHLFHMDSVGTETDLSLTSGDVTGPASSTNNAIPRFVGTGGKTLTSSGVLLDVSNNLGNVNSLEMNSYLEMTEISAPASPAANDLRIYPKDVGGVTHLFTKDSAGTETDLNLAGGSGTPGGATTNVQFNNAGAFGGDADFTWDTGTNTLAVNGITQSEKVHVNGSEINFFGIPISLQASTLAGDMIGPVWGAFGAGDYWAQNTYLKSRGATHGTHGDIVDGDHLGSMVWYASLGGNWFGAADIQVHAFSPGASITGAWYRLRLADSSTGTFQPIFYAWPNIGTGAMSIGANTPPNRSLEVHHDSGATNDVTPVLRLSTRTGGTPLAGIGTGLEFLAETGIGNDEVLGAIHTVTTDVNPSTEDADMVFSLMAAGAAYTEKMRIKSTGEVTLSALTKAGGALRDAVVTLTDAASVALDALLGDTFYLGANGDRTIATPTNKPGSGFIQRITIRHEALGANRTLSLTTGSAGAFRFGTFVTALTATLSGTVDYIGAIYNHLDDRWDVVSYSKGF